MAAPADRDVEEPPPVGRTWPRVYGFVLFALLLSIALLGLLEAVYT